MFFRRKLIVVLILLNFTGIHLLAQRGTEGVTGIVPNTASTTRALVVGISKYKHQAWNLAYAHSDAEKFAGFLMSDFGGNLKPNQLFLITDSLATSPRIKIALNTLAEKSQPRDELILFFAGHGVQEAENAPSYLITHETPFENNFNAGSIPFEYVQSVIDSLTHRHVKVTLIADVCRSGNFASFSKENQKRAATKLLELQNEVRMLSCLPDEVSYEDKTWEGGVFTHFLLAGLMGKADKVEVNQIVTNRELGRYVELGVQLEIEQFNNGQQTPQFILGKNGRKEVAFLKNYQGEILSKVLAHQTGTKDLIPEFLSFESSPEIDQLYQQFQTALKEKRVAYHLPNSALNCFEKLKDEPTVKDFLPLISENLAIIVLEKAKAQIAYFLSEKENPITAKDCQEMALNLDYTLKWSQINESINQELMTLKYFYEGEYLKKKGEQMDYAGWQNDIETAINLLQQASVLDSNAAYINHELGFLYMATRQFEKAEKYFLAAIKSAPTFSYSYINLGNVYHFTDRPEKADSISREAVRVNKNNPISLYNLAIILSRQGKLNKAANVLKQCVKLKPDYLDAHHKLGYLYLKMESFTEAHVIFRKAYALDKENLKTFFGMAQVKKALNDKKEALGLIDACLKIEPNFAPAHFLASDIYLNNNQVDLATKHLNQILAISPNNIEALYFLAYINGEKGDFASAKANCKTILATAPLSNQTTYLTGMGTLNLLGIILMEEQNWTKAKEVLESALPGAKDFPKIYCNLSRVYRAMGQKKAAKQMIAHAFALGEECRSNR